MRRIRKKNVDVFRRGKLFFVGVIFTLCLLVLLGYIGYLKHTYGNEYERNVVIQLYNGKNNVEQTITPNRGSILDRNRQPLAVSDTVYNLVLDVRTLVSLKQAEIDVVVQSLSEILETTQEEISAFLGKDEDGNLINDTKYLVIRRELSRKTASIIEKESLKCVFLEDNTKREYVSGVFAPQVVGFQRDNSTANWGLEGKYNDDLTGEAGRIFRRYDADASPITEEIPATPGYTLITTLDSAIQRIAQEAVDEAGKLYEPQYASVLVMNPNTCEVLAMAQYPSFDNNHPSDPQYFTDELLKSIWNELSDEDKSSYLYRNWINFNISRSFEPGSIFKPVVVAAGLEENLISLSDNYYCGGHTVVLDTDLPCWVIETIGSHGNQTLTQVIANSCNVAMIHIGQILGRDTFFRYRNDFGFGEATGIDLPGEQTNASPVVMYTLDKLNPVELATSSFGQGFNVTSIQAMTAFATLINGGNLMKPYLVSQIVDTDGNVVSENKPTTVRKVISKETSDLMREMLHEVVTPTGTGKKAVIPGYAIGGKTGTAQQGKDRDEYTVSFIAFFPVEDPQYLALALIDRPKGGEEVQGSTSAAPMLQRVMLEIIKYKNLQPSEESEYNVTMPSDAVEVPNYIGAELREATRSLNNFGLDYMVAGKGSRVTGQYPSAGQLATPGSQMILYITDDAEDGELATVPYVTDLDAEEAIELITRSGLTPAPFYDKTDVSEGVDPGEPVTTNPSEDNADYAQTESGITPGMVYEQMPKSGSQVQKGTEVKIKIR